MTDEELKSYCKKVKEALTDLSLTDRLRVMEKVSKKWRRDNSKSIEKEISEDRVRFYGKSIKDIDTIKDEREIPTVKDYGKEGKS